jgi:hypothetical protein
MNQRDVTPGIFPSQHADPEAAHRTAMMSRKLASEALGIGIERRRVEQSALDAAYREGQAAGREEGYEISFAEDYGLGLTVGIICTAVAVALLMVALAMRNPAGCLP